MYGVFYWVCLSQGSDAPISFRQFLVFTSGNTLYIVQSRCRSNFSETVSVNAGPNLLNSLSSVLPLLKSHFIDDVLRCVLVKVKQGENH